MASFDENGKYIKTNWKAGDKITATKLNKIEESIEAVNDNDISRHVEADARLDALEAKDTAHDKEFTNVKNLIADNKAAAELGDYEINSRMQFLEQELNEGIEEVHNVAETVDGKIAKAESDMASAVNKGKADMEAMVAEVEADLEADLEGLHTKDEELSVQLEHMAINVETIGLIPNDETRASQNTITLQNWIDNNDNKVLFFPNTYYIDDTININTSNQYIHYKGNGNMISKIIMITSGKPIFKANSIMAYTKFTDLSISYKEPQTSEYSYCIAFDNDNVLSGSWGHYHWEIKGCRFYNTNIGIGVYNAGDKLNNDLLAIWGCVFRDLYFGNIYQTAINLNSVKPSGMPGNEMVNIKILNQGYTNTGYAIKTRSECKMSNLDIEDWKDNLIYSDTSVGLLIENVHVERHELTKNYESMFYIQGDNVKLSNIHIQDIANKCTEESYVFNLHSNAIVENIKISINTNVNSKPVYTISSNDDINYNIDVKNLTSSFSLTPIWEKGYGKNIIVNGESIKRSSPPTIKDMYNKGEIVYNSDVVKGGYIGWVCIQNGYNRNSPVVDDITLSVSYSQDATVNKIGNLKVGDFIDIVGVTTGSYEISQILNENEIRFKTSVNGNVSNAKISYAKPLWKGFGKIEE